MKNVVVGFAGRASHHVVRGRLVAMGVEFPDAPGTMLLLAVTENERLFEMQDAALPMTRSLRRDSLDRRAAAILHHSGGMGATIKEFCRIENWAAAREVRDLQARATAENERQGETKEKLHRLATT